MKKKPTVARAHEEGRAMHPAHTSSVRCCFFRHSPIFMHEIYSCCKWKHAHFIFISENKGEGLDRPYVLLQRGIEAFPKFFFADKKKYN